MTFSFDALSKPQKPKVEDFDGNFEPLISFDHFATPEIPANLLPDTLGNFVQNISEVLSVPVSMPFMASLGMVSAAIAKKFVVSPKPDWLEPINIYSITAMLPASNKSQTLKYLKSPLDEWEEKETLRIAPLRADALTSIKMLQAELAKQYGILKKKTSKQADIDKAKEDIKRIDLELAEKQESLPPIPQTYTTDATPEAIAQLLDEQGGRLAIISDEGGVTEVLAGLYNNGNANIDIILKGIDGGATRIKRANRDIRLNPYLTVLLLIQPQVLSNMADKRAFTGNGALERYLYALPVGNVGYRTFTEDSIDGFYQDRYNNLIFNLLCITIPERPHILTLETPAKLAFDNFRAEIERELRADGKLFICRGWGGKLAGYTLRLAGLMHIAEHGGAQNLIIRNCTIQNAIQLSRLLMVHTVAVFGLMGMDEETKDAKDVLEWLRTLSKSRLTKSEIINSLRNRNMGKKNRLDKALGLLIERNVLSTAHADYSTRKPKDVYFINPEIYM